MSNHDLHPENNDRSNPELCPLSKDALDALVEAGFNHADVAEAHRERAARVADVLRHLETTDVSGASNELIARCMGRIRDLDTKPAPSWTLCEDDAETLDVLSGLGWDPQRVPAVLRARATRVMGVLSLLDHGTESGDSREVRIQATLARIQASVVADEGLMRLHEVVSAHRGWRLREIAAVAAMLMIGTLLIWPAIGAARQRSQEATCTSRMKSIASAVGQYGSDYKQSMPLATASIAGNLWWNVGKPEQSNSANYFTLRRAGYATLEQLACAGNAVAKSCSLPTDAMDWSRSEEVSFSFQNLFASKRVTLDAPGRWAVAADRSPVVQRAMRGERVVFVDENSFNHKGAGQNVLYNDGSASWLKGPIMLNGDNLWLPRAIEDFVKRVSERANSCQPLKGIEEPSGRDDTFLCP